MRTSIRCALAGVAALVLATPAASRAADKKAERMWKAKCASCHGADGKADTEKGKKMKMADMSSAAFQKQADDALTKPVTDGVSTSKDGVKQEMDAYKDLTPDQIKGLVEVMRSFK